MIQYIDRGEIWDFSMVVYVNLHGSIASSCCWIIPGTYNGD